MSLADVLDLVTTEGWPLCQVCSDPILPNDPHDCEPDMPDDHPGTVRRYGVDLQLPVLLPSKEEAPCCNERRDSLGRYPIGYCSPECVRRPLR